jgi:hypothetical protein
MLIKLKSDDVTVAINRYVAVVVARWAEVVSGTA